MTTTNTYNGWTNYATWRIALEIFDGQIAQDFLRDSRDGLPELSCTLKEYAEEILEGYAGEGLVFDYARAFMDEVNFYEIAEHMWDEYQRDQEQAA